MFHVDDETNGQTQGTTKEDFVRGFGATSPSDTGGQTTPPPHSTTARARNIKSAFGQMFAAVMPSRRGSEQYKAFKESMVKVFEQVNDPDFKISILDLDTASNQDLPFSALIVCGYFRPLNPAEQLVVGYHILLLESTGDRLLPVKGSYRDGNFSREFEIQSPSEQALDKEMLAMAQSVILVNFPRADVRYVSATVVPDFFDTKDEDRVFQIAFTAAHSISQDLTTTVGGVPDINLPALVPENSRLYVKIGFNRRTDFDIVGAPVRNDCQVQFTSASNRSDQHRSHVGRDREQTVSEIGSFIDLVPVPGVNNNAYVPPGYPAAMRGPAYARRLIITQLQSNSFYTPGGVGLALATSFTVGSNEASVQAFMPVQTRQGELDMTDIGALNIDANINNEPSNFGTPICDTKNSDFTLADLGRLMGAYTQRGLIYSIDCPIAGPMTWYTSFLRAMHSKSDPARGVFLTAIDQLTNGMFRNRFNPDWPVTTEVNNIIHLGYWTDVNGKRRDIRDFDLIAVCNILGRQSPGQIREWLNTWYATHIPLEVRLAKRWDLIMAMSGDSAVCTGMAERVTFSNALVNSLSSAMADTKVPVSVQTPLNTGDFYYQRPVNEHVNDSLVVGANVFTASTYGNNNNTGMYAPNNFRWS